MTIKAHLTVPQLLHCMLVCVQHGSVVKVGVKPSLFVSGPPPYGISFKTMPSFPVVEFLFTPHSTERRLVGTGQLSFGFARRKKKDSALFTVESAKTVIANLLGFHDPDSNSIFQH